MKMRISMLTLFLLLVVFGLFPMEAQGQCTLPKTWTMGETLSSTDLNNNFTALLNCYNGGPSIIPPANGGTGLDNSSATGTFRFDAGVGSVGDVKLEHSIYTSLPAVDPTDPFHLRWVTDNQGGIFIDTGLKWISVRGIVDVTLLATGGTGTQADPWTGWDTAIATWTPSTAYLFRPGDHYKTIAGMNINQQGVYLVGGGKRAAFLDFEPTTSGTAINVSMGASTVYLGGISGLRITSSDTTYAKVAINLSDVSDYQLADLFIGSDVGSLYWTGGAGAGSIGLQTNGREMISCSSCSIFADSPIRILANPNSYISLDQAHFKDTYLSGSGMTLPLITVAPNLVLTNITFDGYQAWVRGGFGFYWVDNAGSYTTSSNLRFDNVRWEQSTNASGYAIDIEKQSGLLGLRVVDLLTGFNTNYGGIKLRSVNNVVLDQFLFTGSSGEALNVDSTVTPLSIRNSWAQTGSTASITGLTLIKGVPASTGPIYGDAEYVASPTFNHTYTQVSSTGPTLSLAQNANAFLATDKAMAFVYVLTNQANPALFYLTGTYHGSEKVLDVNTWFSVTPGNVGTINIYWSAGNSRYEIENKTTVNPVLIQWVFVGNYGGF